MWSFEDRADAGWQLARRLTQRAPEDAVVLGLPRGGVPVAAPVASALHAPLDVLIVRKVGVPGHAELAMGAVGEGGAAVRNPSVIDMAGVDDAMLTAAEERERAEVERRSQMLRAGRPAEPIDGRVAIVVDDGIATGASMRAACLIARARGARRIVVAVPVAPPDLLDGFGADVGAEVIALCTPENFMAVGMHYVDFRQTTDDEVIDLLRAAHRSRG
ncbi:phosphoribosyltransferase [Microbacterium esteraromaticum]|uniref:Phosphoribosyltransferase n=1 Tax=Microbacterium esteraromaticum TaxID=57043 RepID=A0A7D8AJZ7_9MICO|nr:phosphoribosyltransferase family protein [Microbacterium esteraromaticum]QMU96327.1 phosphoribosyltransferase [Microbacterium esteraromaticum]